MKFIEMTGKTLAEVISQDEMGPEEMDQAGIVDESIVRVNLQGDIEVRRHDRWDLIGGLIGGFTDRVKEKTGLDFA